MCPHVGPGLEGKVASWIGCQAEDMGVAEPAGAWSCSGLEKMKLPSHETRGCAKA